MPEEVVAFLHRDAEVMDWYRERIPNVLGDLLAGYAGPVGVDAMVYRKTNGDLGLRHVVEVNVRFTMGRVALELLRRFPNRTGRFRVMRKGSWDGNGVALNDPKTAKEFLAIWDYC